MSPIISTFVVSALLHAATLFPPTTLNRLPFDASSYVTNANQIRVAVVKSAQVPVTITLRNDHREVVHQQIIGRKTAKSALLLTVSDLTDGQYELEISSSEGSIRKNVTLSTTPVMQSSRVIALQ